MACTLSIGQRGAGALLCLVIATGICGCSFKGGNAAGPDGAHRNAGDAWQVRPCRMRVYPTSRFVHEGDQTILEARIEFLDEAGDPTKAVGQLRFDLFTAGKAADVTTGRRLYGWQAPLYSVEQNRTFYDPVTRAYLFRLKLDSLSVVSDRVTLKATFIPLAAPRLEASAVLDLKSGVIDSRTLQAR